MKRAYQIILRRWNGEEVVDSVVEEFSGKGAATKARCELNRIQDSCPRANYRLERICLGGKDDNG